MVNVAWNVDFIVFNSEVVEHCFRRSSIVLFRLLPYCFYKIHGLSQRGTPNLKVGASQAHLKAWPLRNMHTQRQKSPFCIFKIVWQIPCHLLLPLSTNYPFSNQFTWKTQSDVAGNSTWARRGWVIRLIAETSMIVILKWCKGHICQLNQDIKPSTRPPECPPWPVWENSSLIGFVWWYSVPVPSQPSSPHTPSAHHCQQARKISLTSSTLHKHSFFIEALSETLKERLHFNIQDEARWVDMVGKTTTSNLGMHPNLSYANFVSITAWPWKDGIKFLSNLKGAWGWMTGLVKYATRCPSSG